MAAMVIAEHQQRGFFVENLLQCQLFFALCRCMIAGPHFQDIFVTNNQTLRRLRYAFDFNDSTMIKIFAHGGLEVSRAQVSDWLKKDDDAAFVAIEDPALAMFLNGLIIEKRGRKDGPQPEPEQKLNHNIVFRKLKIALDLKDEDILALLLLSDFRLSKHELSVFFRRPDHHHYRACQDQVLRNFIKGVQLKFRQDSED
jgi:uncharacterized protein YehS (DUF1456 family)